MTTLNPVLGFMARSGLMEKVSGNFHKPVPGHWSTTDGKAAEQVTGPVKLNLKQLKSL